MEIEIKNNSVSIYLIVKADNVDMQEDITEGLYEKLENGKNDFSKRIGKDISDESMDRIVSMTEDLVHYRQRDYDTSSLINYCFDKLPNDVRTELLKSLCEKYLD